MSNYSSGLGKVIFGFSVGVIVVVLAALYCGLHFVLKVL